MGFWQLDRAEQKRQLQAIRAQQILARPSSVESLDLDNLNALSHKKVVLTGSYDNKKTILISNQFYQSRPGYEVLTAFKLDASNQIIFVSRGWVTVNYNNKQLPSIKPITGKQQLEGEIHIPKANAFFSPQNIDSNSSWPLRVNHFYINNISSLFKTPVLPFVVRLGQDSPGVYKRHWQIERHQPNNSFSYALQWFGMAIILLVITFIKSTNILEITRSNQSIR